MRTIKPSLARLAFAIAVGIAGWVLSASAVGAAQPGVTRVSPEVPNYFVKASDPHGTAGAPSLFADVKNGLLFEPNDNLTGPGGSCWPAARPMYALNIDTYKPLAFGCSGDRPGGGVAGTQTKNIMVGVDSADGLLFFSDAAATLGATQNCSNLPAPCARDSIIAVSEKTLQPVATIALPSGAYPTIYGLSWYAPRDQLIVVTSYNFGPPAENQGLPPPGLAVSAIDIRQALHGGGGALWTAQVPACRYTMLSYFATSNAYRSVNRPHVYVPCELSRSIQGLNEIDGVVRLELGSSGCAVGADACPTGVQEATTLPGQSDDFMFDPGSDRGFLPVQTNSGTTFLVYDGPSANVIGRVAVVIPTNGQANPDLNNMVLGLNPETGRLYATGPAGMALIDGRRTPLGAGLILPSLGGNVDYLSLPALAPDAAHPYTRVFVDFTTPGDSHGSGYIPSFAVFKDTLPVTSDPPVGSIDANTHDIDPSKAASTSYGGSARGYGVHVDLVGGLGGVVNNLTQGTFLNGDSMPLGAGNRDLLAGGIQSLNISTGNSRGQAAALADANATTAVDLARCTSAQAPQRCGLPFPNNGAPTTTQAWPFPDASCSQPGSGNKQDSKTGLYSTGGYNADGSPLQSAVPGTESMASVTVNCLDATPSAGSVTGSSAHSGLAIGPPGLPGGVAVGNSTTTSYVSPPGGGHGVTSHSEAAAHGVDIRVAGHSIQIGEVTQVATATAAGRPHTASGSRQVSLSHVVVDGQVLCSSTCADPGAVVDLLNSRFPTLMRVSQPAPDDRYFPGGSPGGYIAAVQANQAMQYGDRLFNGMGEEEAAYLPAMRIVLYNDGTFQLSRLVVDLAGVETDAEMGLQGAPDLRPTAPLDLSQALTSAGVITTTPGRDAVAGSPGLTGVVRGVIGALGHIIEKVFEGLIWLLRSPLEALQMLLVFCVLCAPVALMLRRRLLVTGVG